MTSPTNYSVGGHSFNQSFQHQFFSCYLHPDIDLRNQWCSASKITLPLISSSSSTTFFSYFASSSLLSTRYFCLQIFSVIFSFLRWERFVPTAYFAYFLSFSYHFTFFKKSIISLFVIYFFPLNFVHYLYLLTNPAHFYLACTYYHIYSLFKILNYSMTSEFLTLLSFIFETVLSFC